MKLVFIGELEKYCNELDSTRSRQYKRLLEQADRYENTILPKAHPGESTTYMGIAIVNLALAYRLSGRKKYLSDARRYMAAVLGWEKWGNAHLVNVDLSASWILFGLSLGYDWLKAELPDDEAKRIIAKIRHHAAIICDYYHDTWGHGWSTNYYQNHNWINMTGLATAGYVLGDACPRSQEYIEVAKENFARVFDLIADDGSNYEGVTYWRYGGMWLFVYAHLLKIQEGYDYFKCCDYLRNTFYYRLYQSCGDMKQQMNFGDCHDRYSGHTACVYYKTAAEYGDGYAQMLGNMVTGEFLMEEAANSKVKPGILPEAALEFLWYEPSVVPKVFDDLPLQRFFEDLGLLSIRSGWKRDAKVLTIKCAAPGGNKQWQRGWQLLQEKDIDIFSLFHHHPDNLSYIFAVGGEYLTCEDGYNRNLMPDNHNVLLVDGQYTDAKDVNDVYMSSVCLRQKADQGFRPDGYRGRVTRMKVDGSLVIYRAETSGVYPKDQEMQEVSRMLMTDGLDFFVFVDVFRSSKTHIYTLQSNTDMPAVRQKDGWLYHLESGDIKYSVLSDKALSCRKYGQQVISVMTTQEPDKVCRTDIQSLAVCSAEPCAMQWMVECFTFVSDDVAFGMENGVFTLTHGEASYQIVLDNVSEQTGLSVLKIKVSRNGKNQIFIM